MKRLQIIIPIILGLCVISQYGWASKAYIADLLTIGLRAEPSLGGKAIDFLSSGQVVEVLENREDWSLVQYIKDGQDSLKGWVLSRYLITRLPWEIQAKSMKKVNTRLEKELAVLQKELRETAHRENILATKLNKMTVNLKESKEAYGSLKEESIDYIRLKTAYEAIQADMKRIERENEDLRSSQTNRWYATGALILLCGLMIGLLVGRQEKKRKVYY